MDLNANSMPISADDIKKKATGIIQSAAAAALAIPPPAGEIVAAGIEALQVAALGVADAVESEFIEPLKKAAPYIDSKYQAKLFEEIGKNMSSIVGEAVKDYCAHKLPKGVPDVIGIDSSQKARTTNLVLNRVFYATGMPQWMAIGAASEMAWDQGNPAFSRQLMDELDDRVGLPRTNRDLGKAMSVAYAKWDSKDGVYGADSEPPPAALPGMDNFDVEWAKQPLPFSEAVLKQSGGLTMAGVELYRASISAAIEDGQYQSEKELFYDWTIRPNPDKSTIAFWHSLSHDLWTKSKYYAEQRKQKEAQYFAENARPEVKTGLSTGAMLAIAAVAVVAVVVVAK